jgi:hypothetical protein
LNILALVGRGNGAEFADNVVALDAQAMAVEIAWLELRRDML